MKPFTISTLASEYLSDTTRFELNLVLLGRWLCTLLNAAFGYGKTMENMRVMSDIGRKPMVVVAYDTCVESAGLTIPLRPVPPKCWELHLTSLDSRITISNQSISHFSFFSPMVPPLPSQRLVEDARFVFFFYTGWACNFYHAGLLLL